MTQPPSPYSHEGSDEQIWRRPDAPEPDRLAPPPAPGYAGPPRGAPAPPGWHPPTLIQVPAARSLPPQDDAALDEQERAARTVTYGIGLVAGAIALLVVFVLCGRVLL